jgi:hypothetical protein
MTKHITNRTWKPEDIKRLEQMVRSGVSAVRAAVVFKRSVLCVKAKAKENGFPFPDERLVKRKRRSQVPLSGSSLYGR